MRLPPFGLIILPMKKLIKSLILIAAALTSVSLFAVPENRFDGSSIKTLESIAEMEELVEESMALLVEKGDIPYLRFVGQYWPRVPVADEDDFIKFSRSFRSNLRGLNEFSGEPTGFDVVECRNFKDKIVMIDVILYHELEASFWRYSFFRPNPDGNWIIMLIGYDRNFRQIFDYAAPVELELTNSFGQSTNRLGSR